MSWTGNTMFTSVRSVYHRGTSNLKTSPPSSRRNFHPVLPPLPRPSPSTPTSSTFVTPPSKLPRVPTTIIPKFGRSKPISSSSSSSSPASSSSPSSLSSSLPGSSSSSTSSLSSAGAAGINGNGGKRVSGHMVWYREIVPAMIPILLLSTTIFLTLSLTRTHLSHARSLSESNERIAQLEAELQRLRLSQAKLREKERKERERILPMVVERVLQKVGAMSEDKAEQPLLV